MRKIQARSVLIPSLILAEVCLPLSVMSFWHRPEILPPSLRPTDIGGVLSLALVLAYVIRLAVPSSSPAIGAIAGGWGAGHHAGSNSPCSAGGLRRRGPSGTPVGSPRR